jgi:hypothetical protein
MNIYDFLTKSLSNITKSLSNFILILLFIIPFIQLKSQPPTNEIKTIDKEPINTITPEERIAWAKNNAQMSDSDRKMRQIYVLQAFGNNYEGLLVETGSDGVFSFKTGLTFDPNNIFTVENNKFKIIVDMGFKWAKITNNEFVDSKYLIKPDGFVLANFQNIPLDISINGRKLYAFLNSTYKGTKFLDLKAIGEQSTILLLTFNSDENSLRSILKNPQLGSNFSSRGFLSIIVSDGYNVNLYSNNLTDSLSSPNLLTAEDLYDKFGIANEIIQQQINDDSNKYKEIIEQSTKNCLTLSFKLADEVRKYEINEKNNKKRIKSEEYFSYKPANDRFWAKGLEKNALEEIYRYKKIIKRVTNGNWNKFWNDLIDYANTFIGGGRWEPFAGGFGEYYVTTGSVKKDDQIRKELLVEISRLKLKYKDEIVKKGNEGLGIESTSDRDERGIVIGKIERVGTAHKLGIQKGDILLSFNDIPTKEDWRLQLIVDSCKPGEFVKVKWIHDNKNLEGILEIKESLWN